MFNKLHILSVLFCSLFPVWSSFFITVPMNSTTFIEKRLRRRLHRTVLSFLLQTTISVLYMSESYRHVTFGIVRCKISDGRKRLNPHRLIRQILGSNRSRVYDTNVVNLDCRLPVVLFRFFKARRRPPLSHCIPDTSRSPANVSPISCWFSLFWASPKIIHNG